MSIFGKLRRAKQAADNQKDKKAESKTEPAPYRHLPTHAATDALLGAPATWREQDKKAIQAQHQRRSQHNLSRNQSSLSNVTTFNRDRSITSGEWAHSAANKRKHYSTDWAGTASVPRNSRITSSGSSSGTNFSRRSQFPSTDRSSRHTDARKSRLDTAESATQPASAVDYPSHPGQDVADPSKDVKFHLPLGRDISPSHSSDNSHSSSRELSFHEPAVPARHPHRPIVQGSSAHKYDHQAHLQQPSQKFYGKIGEFPRPPAARDQQHADMFPLPPTTQNRHRENDLSFIKIQL